MLTSGRHEPLAVAAAGLPEGRKVYGEYPFRNLPNHPFGFSPQGCYSTHDEGGHQSVSQPFGNPMNRRRTLCIFSRLAAARDTPKRPTISVAPNDRPLSHNCAQSRQVTQVRWDTSSHCQVTHDCTPCEIGMSRIICSERLTRQ